MDELIDPTEMYLKVVLEYEEAGIVPVRARLSERLGQAPSTVTQTVGRMVREDLFFSVPGDRQISHEAIYRSLYTSTRLALPPTLHKHLRSGRSVRHPRSASKLRQGRGRLVNMQSIHVRPAAIQERMEAGIGRAILLWGGDRALWRHWLRDLLGWCAW